MQRGTSGGFRLLAYYSKASNTLYPFYVYTKKDHEKDTAEQPPYKDMKKWLAELVLELGSDSNSASP